MLVLKFQIKSLKCLQMYSVLYFSKIVVGICINKEEYENVKILKEVYRDGNIFTFNFAVSILFVQF